MKSNIILIFVVLFGLVMVSLPVNCHAIPHNSTIIIQEAPAPEISMESFRAGILNQDATLNLANLCLNTRQYNNAEEVIDKLRIVLPDNEDVMRMAVWAYEATGHPEKAISVYELLLKRYPDDLRLNISAARAYSWTGRFTTAIKIYDGLVRAGKNTDAVVPGDIIMAEYADVLYWDKQNMNAALYYQMLWQKGVLHKQQAINFVYTLIGAKDKSAQQILDSLAKQYPDDIMVIQVTADASFAFNDYKKATALYTELISKKPDEPLFYNKLAEIEVAQNNYSEALKISYSNLLRFHDNETALLTIARVSSWQKDYATSLAYYDKLIALGRPETVNYYREKARVLGWMNEFSKAFSVYDEAVGKYPQNETLKAEANAKKGLYRNAYRSAEISYKKWLEAEPLQPSALSDLGQLYMQYGNWKKASEVYNRLLALMPDFKPAVLAKQKADNFSSMTLLQSGTEYSSIKSNWQDVNVTYKAVYNNLSHSFDENISGFLKLDTKFFSFEEHSFTQQGITAGIEYHNMPDIILRSAYGFHKSSDKDSYTGFVETQSLPMDNTHLALSFHREDVDDNERTFKNGIQKNVWQGRVVYDGYRAWRAGIDYTWASYSDNNTSITTGADITTHLLYAPQCLNLFYRFQNYGFTERSINSDYWHPYSFITHTVGLEWQQYLNKERSPGSDNLYYTTAYNISLEPEGNISHLVQASLYCDWSNRFSTLMACQYAWATKYFYQNKILKAEVQWLF